MDLDWNQHLPYDTKEEWIDRLKQDFSILIRSDSLNGISDLVSKLRLLLDLKLDLPLKDRIWFSHLFYALVTSKSVGIEISRQFCDLFSLLTADISKVKDEDLSLNWRPLYEILYDSTYPKHGRTTQTTVSAIPSLVKLVCRASRFFPSDSAVQILDEIIPRLNIHDLNCWTHHLATLVTLIPVTKVPDRIPGLIHPGFHWVPLMFNLWSRVVNSSVFDGLFLDLFSRLAKAQVKSPHLIGSRMLNLPVGSGSSGLDTKTNGVSEYGVMEYPVSLPGYFATSKSKSLARLIVYSLFPTDSGIKIDVLGLLESFLRSIETFAHPSNSGRWSSSISKLCFEITEFLFERVTAGTFFLTIESKDTCDTPMKYRLQPKLVHAVTLMLDPIVRMALFGKDSACVSSSQRAYKYLAWLNPQGILPGLLENVYPALSTVIETHRTISCLSVLSSVATPLLRQSHYPEGAKNLMPLLNLILPGLDLNDSHKSVVTMMTIISLIVHVPLVDSSSHPSTNETHDQELCRLASAEYEVWLAAFIDRVFSILENLPQNFGVGSRMNVEENMLYILYVTSDAVFSQLSLDFEDMVINMLYKKAESSLVPSATEAIGVLCGSIAKSNPKKRLAKFLPLCLERIREELDSGAGATVGGNRYVANTNPFDFAKMSDASLHWFQSIAMSIVNQAGAALLEFIGPIEELIDMLLEKCVSKRGYLWCGYLIRVVLESLASVYPIENSSHHLALWNDAKFRESAHKHIAEEVDFDNLKMDWHIPSEAEVQLATRLASKYLDRSSNELKKLMENADGSANVLGNEFRRWICYLSNVAIGCSTFVQPSNEYDHDNFGDFTETYAPKTKSFILEGGFLFKDPTDSRYKEWSKKSADVQHLMNGCLEYFLIHRPDDIESVKALLSAIEQHIVDSGNYDLVNWVFSFYKNLFKAGRETTVLPRFHFVKGIHRLHYRRMYNIQKNQPTTPVIRSIMNSLLKLSLSKYAEVRQTAQQSLFNCLKCHRSARFDIFSSITSVLQEKGQEHDPDRIKGALYLLKDRSSIMGVYIYYWEFIGVFFKSLLNLWAEEKPSILELIRVIYIDFIKSFSPPKVFVIFPDELKNLMLQDSKTDAEVVETRKKRDRKVATQEEYRTNIQSILLSLVFQNSKWRFTSMAISFFDLVLTVKLPIQANLVNLSFLWLVDEHPKLRTNCLSLLCHLIDNLKDRAQLAGTSAIDGLRRTYHNSSPEFQAAIKDSEIFGTVKGAEYAGYWDKAQSWLIYGRVAKTRLVEGLPIGSEPFTEAGSSEALKILISNFCSIQFWDKWLAYALEELATESFSKTVASFYKRIFMLCGDKALDVVLPKLQKLVESTKDSTSQRAAAELLAGILRGSKYWNHSQREKLSDVTDILFIAINGATMETVSYWLQCLTFTFANRDSKRYSAIICRILEMQSDLSNSSFLAECKKLWLKDVVMTQFTTQIGAETLNMLLLEMSNMVTSPYQLVRDSVGGALNRCLLLLDKRRYDGIESLMNFAISNMHNSHASLLPQNQILVDCFGRIRQLKAVYIDNPTNTSSSYLQGILSWFQAALTTYSASFAVFKYLEDVISMQDSSDQDLSISAETVCRIFPNYIQDSPQLEKTIHTLGSLCYEITEKEWQKKTKILPILQLLYYRHLLLLTQESKRNIMNLLYFLIRDPQVEVRKLASITLSGLVQCSERAEIDGMIDRFSLLISDTKLPKRQKNEPASSNYGELVGKRHAGVLGLCSLVLAFPYDIPEWMPLILVILADVACGSEVSSITNSIYHTFGEFKRTHQDTWEIDKGKFTDEQLYTISDLIYSPGYYA